MSLIRQRSQGGRLVAMDANGLKASNGLNRYKIVEEKKIQALADPGAYLAARLAAIEATNTAAFATYGTYRQKYIDLGYDDITADEFAQKMAKATMDVEIEIVKKNYPEIRNIGLGDVAHNAEIRRTKTKARKAARAEVKLAGGRLGAAP